MLENYTEIKNYRCNQGSSGTISEQDRKEILDMLNSKKYTSRQTASEELHDSDLKEVISEIEHEVRLTQIDAYAYLDNCHSLTRKMKERLGWITIVGYAIDKNQLKQSFAVLRSHSVTKDKSGTIFELTYSFPPESHYFIEHKTGVFGIDLQAYRRN